MIHWWTPTDSILARITTLLSEYPSWTARSAADLSAILQLQETARVVFLIPLGSPNTNSQGNGQVADIRQRYAIVFSVKAASDLSGDIRRAEAGPVIWHLLPRLMAWPPGSGWTPLEMVAAPAADYIREEYAYFPFAFETAVRLTAIRGS